MQKEEPGGPFADFDIADCRRKTRAGRTAQYQAGTSGVFGRIKNIKEDAARRLPSERNRSEIIASLVEPAAFAVIVDLIGESPIGVWSQVDRRQARFDRGIFAVLRFDERPRLRPQYRSRRCVCNQVAEVDRSRTVAVPAEDRIQLRQHNPAFSAGSFDDRVGDQVGFIQARSPDGDGIYGMRREGAADHITVIRVVPGIEFIPRKPPEHRMAGDDQINEIISLAEYFLPSGHG